MENFAAVAAYLLIGLLLKRIPAFGKDTGNYLNLFVIYVSLPALILLKAHGLTFDSRLLIPAITSWGILIISAAIVLLLSNYFDWDRKVTGCLLLVIPLGNTSFLGIPMVEAFFGSGGIVYALIYDQLGSFLALALYGAVIISIYSGEAGRPSGKKILLKIISFPPFVSICAAFALSSFEYHSVIEHILKSLADTLVPVVMIAVGFQVSIKVRREETMPLAAGLAIKLLIAPLIVIIIFYLLNVTGESAQVSAFESGMPPMVTAAALAITAGLAPALASALAGFGIALSFATLPILFTLIKSVL